MASVPTASIRYVRSWKECGLNADMAFWAGFDPKRTFLPWRLLHLIQINVVANAIS